MIIAVSLAICYANDELLEVEIYIVRYEYTNIFKNLVISKQKLKTTQYKSKISLLKVAKSKKTIF